MSEDCEKDRLDELKEIEDSNFSGLKYLEERDSKVTVEQILPLIEYVENLRGIVEYLMVRCTDLDCAINGGDRQ